MVPTLTLAAARRFRTLLSGMLFSILLAVAAGTAQAAAVPRILVLGDSLSAAYGLATGEGWVALLQRKLAGEGYPHRVVNASVSGDTTAGGRARIGPLLAEHRPDVVVVELGGNDGLRGASLEATRENLLHIVSAVKKANARPLLVGVELPPNYGPQYTRRFSRMFEDVATVSGAPLVPSLLAGFAARLELFQPDRIHPTAAAQAMILDTVWPALEPLVGKPHRAARK